MAHTNTAVHHFSSFSQFHHPFEKSSKIKKIFYALLFRSMEKANTHRLDFFFFFFFFDPMNDPLKEEQSPKKKKQNDKASGRRGGGGAHHPGELKGERERVIVARRIYRSEEKMRRPNFESLANNPGFQYPHPRCLLLSLFLFYSSSLRSYIVYKPRKLPRSQNRYLFKYKSTGNNAFIRISHVHSHVKTVRVIAPCPRDNSMSPVVDIRNNTTRTRVHLST